MISGEEATRQFGQLERELRGREVEASLSIPARTAQTLQFQQQFAGVQQEFAANLRQQSFLNRLRLTEPIGTIESLRSLRKAQPTTRGEFTESPISAFGQIAGGIGGIATGAGDLGP